MSTSRRRTYKQADYKSDVKPIWCPGCGDYHVLMSFGRAFAQLGLPPEQIAVISGIGCSSRIPAYTNCYGFHGVHGRSLALAAGLKVTRPDLTVVVASGDGDGYSIGGNHFLHACRRNVDMTYVVMDNHIYGMTKGQPSPTTEPEFDTALSPGGTGVRPFHPLVVALASGANFIARCFSGDPNETADVLVEAIKHPGFSFVEILSPCVTFRPDEKAWKDQVHPAPVTETSDQGKAARRLMTDDGFNIGILYRGTRTPYQPAAGAKRYRPVRAGEGLRAMSKIAGHSEGRQPQRSAWPSPTRSRSTRSTATSCWPTRWKPTTIRNWSRSSAIWPAPKASMARKSAAWPAISTSPPAPAKSRNSSKGESPEEADLGSAHYMMTPWHALQLSLAGEKRALAYFTSIVENSKRSQGQGSWRPNWSKRRPSTSSSCIGCCAAIRSRARIGPTISIRRCRRNKNFPRCPRRSIPPRMRGGCRERLRAAGGRCGLRLHGERTAPGELRSPPSPCRGGIKKARKRHRPCSLEGAGYAVVRSAVLEKNRGRAGRQGPMERTRGPRRLATSRRARSPITASPPFPWRPARGVCEVCSVSPPVDVPFQASRLFTKEPAYPPL